MLKDKIVSKCMRNKILKQMDSFWHFHNFFIIIIIIVIVIVILYYKLKSC